MAERFPDVSFFELSLFHHATQLGSLRALSRELGLQPAHVSKVLKRLETKLGIRLFQRTAQGMTVTPEGLAILDRVKEILALSQTLSDGGSGAKGGARGRVWTFGSISFLSTYCLAHMVAAFPPQREKARFRIVEFTHNDLVALGLKGAFELALHIGPLEWTKLWMSRSVGTMRWALYGKRGHPLGAAADSAKVAQQPFVIPIDWSEHGYSAGDDFCPLPVRNRTAGAEVSTAETALEVARASDQLTFVPTIVAEPWLRAQLVQEIQVRDWPRIEQEIFLSFRSDLVPNPLLQALLPVIKQGLKTGAEGRGR